MSRRGAETQRKGGWGIEVGFCGDDLNDTRCDGGNRIRIISVGARLMPLTLSHA